MTTQPSALPPPTPETPGNPHLATPSGKPRAHSLALSFRSTPGPWNAITDIPGIEAGYQTMIEGETISTGVTAIHPEARPPAATRGPQTFTLTTATARTGVSWIEETGTFFGIVAITNTQA